MKLVIVATCSLNQWALDFKGNLERIKKSILIAKSRGATYRLGPELEIPGYGCEDHFLEPDTELHSWECVADILSCDLSRDILLDLGLAVSFRGVLYNCRVLIKNQEIVLVRPKQNLAQDGNYRERRWFQAWQYRNKTFAFALPQCVIDVTGQRTVPFGDAVVRFADNVTVGVETCEELFVPDSPHIRMGLAGVDILGNGSGSHHELRKLHTRVELMRMATKKSGGIYLYANQQGCDGGRLYYDGSAMIVVNGSVVAQGSQFSFRDVEVVSAVVDVDAVRSYRCSINSRGALAAQLNEPLLPIVTSASRFVVGPRVAQPLARNVAPRYSTPMQEIGFGPSTWLWDYVRRSGLAGFFLPLSGGADSSSVAAIVGCMCQRLCAAIADESGDAEYAAEVLAQVRAVVKPSDADWRPADARELCSRVFYTCYMGTRNSSSETRERAARLAREVGATHLDTNIDEMVASIESTFARATGRTQQPPRFASAGGSSRENLALQNIQARSRMVFGYMLAQLLPWSHERPGSLLVLAAGNVDEALRGYLTKYDASAADLNPIGSVSKVDLRAFLEWAADELGFKSLLDVRQAPPTAELEPITDSYVQSDEADMGMTYDELGEFGRLRIEQRCGPLSMFETLWTRNSAHESPASIAKRVKHFFFYYSINRHKTTVLTPSYHAESYSPDDNRYDLRPFLYNARWSWQFAAIDKRVAQLSAASSAAASAAAAAASASPPTDTTSKQAALRKLLAANGFSLADVEQLLQKP